jgi:hypothetical protein
MIEFSEDGLANVLGAVGGQKFHILLFRSLRIVASDDIPVYRRLFVRREGLHLRALPNGKRNEGDQNHGTAEPE